MSLVVPRLGYQTLSAYTYVSARTPAGYNVRLAIINVEDLPASVCKCSICGARFIKGQSSESNPQQPVALDCGHVYCASCVFERVDCEMGAFQGCVGCDPKVSQATLLRSQCETVIADEQAISRSGHAGRLRDDIATARDKSSDSETTLSDSGSLSTTSTLPTYDFCRKQEIANRVPIKGIRAVELLADMTRHAPERDFTKRPTREVMKKALTAFSDRYEVDLTFESLDAVLTLMNVRNGTSISLVDALGPWLRYCQ